MTAHTYGDTLRHRELQPFLWTQFLGAFNDNLCKIVVSTADRIILLVGILTLLASIYVLSVVPEFLVRFCLWLLTHTIYRIRIEGQKHVPSRGPARLVCNHLSHVDGALVGACIQRFVRFLPRRRSASR